MWLINTHNGIKEKGIPPVNIEEFPAIKAHLDSFGDKLKKRTDKGNTPYNLRNCAYMEDFSKQKIVWGNLNLSAQYCFVEEGIFINAPCAMIVPAERYLLAILNSSLADYYIRTLGVTRNGGYFEYKPMFVEKLPAPTLTDEQKMHLELLIERGDDVAVDEFVFALYHLDESEITYITNTKKKDRKAATS